MVYAENRQKKPLSILLVEDNPAHAELIKRSLEEFRHRSDIVHLMDGEQALDYLFQRGIYAHRTTQQLPHLILLDLRLPGLSGFDVLKQIRAAAEETLRRIPVVILSTSGAESDVACAYESHANGYIVKPMDFEELTSLMNSVCTYWLGVNYYPWSQGVS